MLKTFFKYLSEDIISKEQVNVLCLKLTLCASIENKKEFVDKIIEILKPLFDIREKYSIEFEEAEARASNDASGFLELNRLVRYEKKGDTIHLHHDKA